ATHCHRRRDHLCAAIRQPARDDHCGDATRRPGHATGEVAADATGSRGAERPQTTGEVMPANPDRDLVYEQTRRYFFAPVASLLYDDDTVSEVMINGPTEIYFERRGRVERAVGVAFADEHALAAAVRNLAEFVNRMVDERQPTMDARLPEPHKFRV